MGSYRICCCFTRRFGLIELEPPCDVRDYFKKFSAGGAYMAPDQLLRFLQEVQESREMTIIDAEKIVEGVLHQRHHIAKYTRNSLTLDDFFYYLFSVDFNPPFKPQIHQDMNASLSHYFIYTGHNSYLTGNQLIGDSSDKMIITALKQGVRVIELDLWSSKSNKDAINVLHGRTFTTPVDLQICLKAIRDHAFVTSEYPVIITLEDHLKPRLQAIAAQMITQTFGNLLYHPESEDLKEFPSPEKLKHKILISTKPPEECLQAESHVHNTSISSNDSSDRGKDVIELEHPSQRKIDGFESEDEHNHINGDDFNSYSQPFEPSAYKSLIAIPQRKGKWKEAAKTDPDKAVRVSLSEQKLEEVVASHGTDVVRFTQKNILRIYPKGTRFNSSNYNPFVGWMHGAQMVAFNMQGYGRSLWQMHGMFRANGGCGYVKKPNFLIDGDPTFDPQSKKMPVKTTLKVKIYMGDGWRMDFTKTHFDKYSPPDFYVKVGIGGVPADETMHMTEVKDDEWIPIWNQEFTFPLTVPELALLRIQVYEYDNDKKDDFGGQTCLPVSELTPGIHAIPLYSRKGEKFNSVKLLMRFKFM